MSKLAGSATDSNLIFAATSDGVYRSTNGGTSWTQVTFEEARAVAVDPANDQNVLIGVPGAGIYRSSDRGATFVYSSAGLDSTDVRALVAAPVANMFFVGLNGNATGGWGGVFQSTDGGATWTSWNGSAGALPSSFVTSLVVTASGAVIAGTYDPRPAAWPTPRRERSWTAASRRTLRAYSLHVDRNSASTVWLGTRVQGVYKSTNDGTTFRGSSQSAPRRYHQRARAGNDPELRDACSPAPTASGCTCRPTVAVSGQEFVGAHRGSRHRTRAGRGRRRIVHGHAERRRPAQHQLRRELRRRQQRSRQRVYGAKALERRLDRGHRWRGLRRDLRIWWPLPVERKHRRGRASETGLPNANTAFSNPMGVAIDPSNAQNVFYALFDGGSAGTWRRNGGPSWSVATGPRRRGSGARRRRGDAGKQRWYILNQDAPADRSTDNGVTWNAVTLTAAASAVRRRSRSSRLPRTRSRRPMSSRARARDFPKSIDAGATSTSSTRPVSRRPNSPDSRSRRWSTTASSARTVPDASTAATTAARRGSCSETASSLVDRRRALAEQPRVPVDRRRRRDAARPDLPMSSFRASGIAALGALARGAPRSP